MLSPPGAAAHGYQTLRTGVGLIPRPETGRIRLTGADRVALLNRTTTGDLRRLGPGSGALTVIQNDTARILDWPALYQGESELWVVTGPGRGAETAAWIDKLVIMDDVVVEELTATTSHLELCGPRAPEVAAAFVGEEVRGFAPHQHRTVDCDGHPVLVAAGREQTPPYFVLLVPAEGIEALTRRLVELGAEPVDPAAAEVLRVELGVPAVGRELTLDANPLEARLHRSISFDKGCYTGQEIIAKMITHKSTQRTLVGYFLARDVSEPRPWHWLPVIRDDEVVGRLTSAARAGGTGRWIGLGILKNELASAGTLLAVEMVPGGFPAGGGPKLGARRPESSPDGAPRQAVIVAGLPFDLA